MSTRDMTNKEFFAACKRHGFVQECLGYWRVTDSLRVYPGNAGTRRRDQLAYMIRCRDKQQQLKEAIESKNPC